MTWAIKLLPEPKSVTRKASLQETADRLAEIKTLFRTCLKLEPNWRNRRAKSLKTKKVAR